jgi:pimeloyl-ACP methyl ester carboxylesterase/DNA-binding CsgD family transcriptional regulator
LQTVVVPATRYAKSGEVSIAYQVFGDGPVDLVFVPGFISHIELAWEEPYLARFLRRLAAFTRVIFFDKRGTGLSDPVARPPGLAERMDDIGAVMDAAGSQTAALFGVSDGGCLCIAFTVAHPERSAALVTYGSFARRLRSADYPWGWPKEHLEEVLAGMDRGWASGKWWAAANPSVANDERYQAWWARYLRAAASPSMGRGALGLNAELDIRDLLAKVDVPTLVIHRTLEQWVDVGNSRYLAAHITGARLVEASGVDHRPWLGDADEIMDAIETFLTGTPARSRTARYAAGADALSRREREIVALTMAGETAPAIAKALFISERTVESHLARAYVKLGVHSKLEVARRAAELGLEPDLP